MKINDAIILAGGKGKRMRSVTMDKFPKSLTPIQNKTIIEWELEWLAREGINHAILAVGYMSDMIKSKLGLQFESQYGTLDLDYSVEQSKLGSGGAVKLASSYVTNDPCLIMNGDLLLNTDLSKMKDIHKNQNAAATMLLIKMRSPYGVVQTQENKILKFEEKPLLDVYIHGGVDIINKEVLPRFPEIGQMEETIFVELANEQTFMSYKAPNSDFWMSIDGEKDYENANEKWVGF